MKIFEELNKPIYSAIFSAAIVIATIKADVATIKQDVVMLKNKMLETSEKLSYIEGAWANSDQLTITKR